MSQAQAAALGVSELAAKYQTLLNFIQSNLPGGSAKQAAVQALLTAKAAALAALTG